LPTSVIFVVNSTFDGLGRGDAPPGLGDPASGLGVAPREADRGPRRGESGSCGGSGLAMSIDTEAMGRLVVCHGGRLIEEAPRGADLDGAGRSGAPDTD
jgi:hypothetical protein